MTKSELSQAMKIATDGMLDLSAHDDEVLYGCGLPGFKPVYTTVYVVARFLRWQCQNLNGTFNSEEVDEMCRLLKKKVFIV